MAQTYREAYDAATKKLKAANAQVADLKDSVALAEGKLRNALAEVKNAQVAARLAEQTASELRARLNTALARIKELEADPPDCAPLVDAARKEGRTTMQAEAVLAITALVP
jgi:chromosome segregation ATPase